MIPQITTYQKELFEVLGKIRIAFIIDDELDKKINSLYKYLGADIPVWDKTKITTIKELDSYHQKANLEIQNYIKNDINEIFEELFPLLLKQIKRN